MDFEQLQSDLFSLLGTLPEGTNPYSAIIELIHSNILPPVSNSLYIQLYVLAGVFALALLCVLASLLIRVYAGNFWLMRINSSGLISPHYSISWSLFAAVLVVLLLVQIFRMVAFYQGQVITKDFLAMSIFPWTAAWTAGWLATWSLTVSYVSHLNAQGHFQLTSSRARWINVALIVPLVAYYVCTLPFSIGAAVDYNKLLHAYNQFFAFIRAGESNWEQTRTFSILDLLPAQSILTEFEQGLEKLGNSLSGTFYAYAASGIFIFSVIAFVAVKHLRSLKKILRKNQDLVQSGSSSGIQDKALATTFNNLVATLSAFTIICTLFTVVCIYIASSPLRSFTSAFAAQFQSLLPLYVFAVFGLPTAILLFVRSLDVTAYNKGNSASGIRIGDGSAIITAGSLPKGFDVVDMELAIRNSRTISDADVLELKGLPHESTLGEGFSSHVTAPDLTHSARIEKPFSIGVTRR